MVCLSRQQDERRRRFDKRWFYALYPLAEFVVGLLLVLMNFRPLIAAELLKRSDRCCWLSPAACWSYRPTISILLFVALELISIPTYILLYLGPGEVGPGIGRKVFLPKRARLGHIALRI